VSSRAEMKALPVFSAFLFQAAPTSQPVSVNTR